MEIEKGLPEFTYLIPLQVPLGEGMKLERGAETPI